ncbi:D-Ala-D-Ala carboxypeptidase [Legionella lansingensis]|uniref:D-Ala-D-Ala carboxypeptidase n=1 Tax=Legionella lansingensis TaxID=45067 RepID=A0A0W0VED3_9GAMM|nr:D-alanyl-D-alanine carboxypeptidase/D-alanyl-D-alanine-endopeptidase [Legionella lansingensis]KTD18483.1 D-Ala-D-Ala carboxypeptidase [Legionella lansingensis]SNV50160.1 D-Ala-D-Ala carboxypeptidase [Legionella lansingensis]
MLRYIFALIFTVCLLNQAICAQTLSEKIEALIEKELPHATIGILVKDAQTGETLYSKNKDKLFSPASNMKIFTAAAAFYQLSPNYHFLTTLAQKNHDFYITFSGSPSLTTVNLMDLLLNLKNKAKVITGNIILDISRFKPPYYASGTSYDDLGWYYSAPDTAAILDENSVDFDVISSKKLGELAQIIPKLPDPPLTIINQVITVSKEEEKNHCNLNVDIEANNTLRLFGCIAQEDQPKTMKLAVPDPVLMVRRLIKKALITHGVLLKGKIITGHAPLDAQPIVSFQSDDLIQLITHMLQESDNLYASSLSKQLAYEVTGDGSYKQSAFAIKKILTQHTHLDWSQVELADGIGTRYNLVTPEQMVVLLTDIYNDKNIQPVFLKALPQAGVSGTLKDRMKKTKLDKMVFAKTGTMHDISSLSGYIIYPNGKSLIFSIIINGVNAPINAARSLEERILLLLDSEQLALG